MIPYLMYFCASFKHLRYMQVGLSILTLDKYFLLQNQTLAHTHAPLSEKANRYNFLPFLIFLPPFKIRHIKKTLLFSGF